MVAKLLTQKPVNQFVSRLTHKHPVMILMACLFLMIGRFLLLGAVNVVGLLADAFCSNAICSSNSLLFASATAEQLLQLLFLTSGLGYLVYSFGSVWFARIGNGAIGDLLNLSFSRAIRFPLAYFDKTPVGQIFSRFSNDYIKASRASGGPSSDAFAGCMEMVGIFFLIVISDARFSFLPIISVVAYFWVYKKNIDMIREASLQQSLKSGPTIAHFSETVRGRETICVYGKQNAFLAKFYELLHDLVEARAKASVASQLLYVQFNILGSFLFILVSAFGLVLAYHGSLSIGGLAVALTFVLTTGNSMQILLDRFAMIQSGLTGAERLEEFVKKDLEKDQSMNLPIKEKKVINGSIQVKNLSVRYDGNAKPVLKNLNIDIEPGEFIGVIGRTGAGKSSLFQALMHLYEWESGEVLVGGVSVRDVTLDEFREYFSYISQDPTIFNGTLRQNLTGEWGREVSSSDFELQDVLVQVGLGDWYAGLNDGFDSKLEESGGNLSAGQRQLIAIARCFLKDSPIILMDEATSSIDPETEAQLSKVVQKTLKGRTRFVIAHRLSTVERCDRIIWLDDGSIKMFDQARIVLEAYLNR